MIASPARTIAVMAGSASYLGLAILGWGGLATFLARSNESAIWYA
jgi:hypothetical protein